MKLAKIEKLFINRELHSKKVIDRAEKLLGFIDIKTYQNMLEIGCGNGAVSKHIYDKYRLNVTGTDIDKEQIELAKTNAKDLKNITFLFADATNLPFGDKSFDKTSIDPPIAKMIEKFLAMPFCFTLQSCYGHFLYKGQSNPYSIEAIPKSNIIRTFEYRIAYTAFCIQESMEGKKLFEELNNICQIDKKYIQFGCAKWFWKRFLNSFVLQVEPERYSTEDKIFVEYEEALYIEDIRNKFFKKLSVAIADIALK